MVTGSGWEASPWLVPAGIVVLCLVIVALVAYLGRDLLGRRYHAAAEDELRAAQRWIRMVDERRDEPPAAEWDAFVAEERERLDAERERLAIAIGIEDAGEPVPPGEIAPYVVEALNGHTNTDDCLDSIFTRHGVQ